MGVISKAEPWVYLEIKKPNSIVKEHYKIWGDTVCDGVERLKNKVHWNFEVCDDKFL